MSPDCRAALVRALVKAPEFLERPAAEFLAPVLQAMIWDGRPKAWEAIALGTLREALAGRYALRKEIGRGGMARVFRARDLRHRRPVALKVMRGEHHIAGAAEGFLREIRIVAGLTHPHILSLHDSGSTDGVSWFVMPFIAGESLRSRISREGPLPVEEVVRVLIHVAEALAYAHRRGIVHRDVKPENILLHEGHALLADFGIAGTIAASPSGIRRQTGTAKRSTVTRAMLGTPAYMAPEQVTGSARSDHRADLYALGLVGYEMLAGAHPFVRETLEEMLAAQLTAAAAPLGATRPDLPEALTRLVERLLAKRPGDRPRDAGTVVAELERIRPPGLRVSSRTPPGAVRAPRRARPR